MVTKKRKEKKSNDILFAVLCSVLFIGVFVILIFSNWRINQRRETLLLQIDDLKKEIQAAEEKKAELEQGILNTQKDSYWEDKAREEGYKKEGEEQVVILPPKPGENTNTTTEKNFWQKILEKLGL